MPNTKSAAKRLRSNAKRRLINQIAKSRIKSSEQVLRDAIAAGDKTAAENALTDCFALLDRAARKGAIHKNQADRKKSRLTARVRDMV